MRIRAEHWRVMRYVPYGDASVLDVTGQDRTNRGRTARFVLPFESVDSVPAMRSPRVVRPARWRRIARQALAGATPSIDSLRTAAGASLTVLPFQLEPALALTRGLGCRLLIADEVGLGKTIQAGLIVAELLARTPGAHVLVVAPAGLREQWQAEMDARFGLTSAILDTAALARGRLLPAANPWWVHPLVIASVDFVKRPEVMRSLEGLIWDLVVFDEAHALAGSSDRALAASTLGERARTIVLLSATPHSGDDEAFRRLCAIGNLRRQFPLLLFRRTRQDAGLAVSRRTVWLRVRPTPIELQMHEAFAAYARLVWKESGPSGRAARLAMSVLARRACSSAASLARSVERRLMLLRTHSGTDVLQLALPFAHVPSDDDEPSALLMAPGLQDDDDEQRRLEEILSLARRAAGSESKLDALRRLLRRAAEPVIVFTEYRDTLDHVASVLRDTHAVTLHGGLTPRDRTDALRQFTAGDARLLLATDAAGEGVNLHQRCRLVVTLELPWTPLRLEQRIGRVERIGQQSRVHAVHLVAADTSEEMVVAKLLQRMARIRTVLGGMRVHAGCEEEIPQALMSDEPLADPASPRETPLPPDILVPDLRAASQVEAERLLMTRRLAAGLHDASIYARPPVARLNARRPLRRCYWAFRLEVSDAAGQLLWEPIVAFYAAAGVRAPRGAASIRRLLDPTQPALEQAVAHAHQDVIAAARAALEASLELGARREQALMDVLAERHARMSAALVQPGLFDRRTQRAAAAQGVILAEALARCAAALDRLEQARDLASGCRELAFAVTLA